MYKLCVHYRYSEDSDEYKIKKKDDFFFTSECLIILLPEDVYDCILLRDIDSINVE